MSKIEWTEKTCNAIIGCTKVSPGCDHCYAEKMAYRLYKMGQYRYGHVTLRNKWSGHTHFVQSALDKVLKRTIPTMYFMSSMGDMFHESVSWGDIEKVMDVIEECQRHTFQILTKRPENMAEYFNALGKRFELSCCPNLWLGTTVEHPDYKHRIDELRKIPAAIKFLSLEPLLADLGELSLDGIGWVICGGESGPGARPMHPDWPKSLRDQCKAASVPFFFKQWGKFGDAPGGVRPTDVCISPDGCCETAGKRYVCVGNESEGEWRRPVGKKKAGSLLDGVEHKEYPK